jgi:hypothetical protein
VQAERSYSVVFERAVAYAVAALGDRTRPGKEPTITAEAKARLISLACQRGKLSERAADDTAAGPPTRTWSGPAGHQCLAKLAPGTVCKILNREAIKRAKSATSSEGATPSLWRKWPKFSDCIAKSQSSRTPPIARSSS